MLGYAATTDVKDVPVVVADGDRSSASRELIARFDASRNFTIIDTVTTVSQIEPYLERGSAWLALSIPGGLRSRIWRREAGDRAGRGGRNGFELDHRGAGLLDEPRSVTTRRNLTRNGSRRSPAADIDARIRVWFNPQLESRHFMIPGVLALILLGRDGEPRVDGASCARRSSARSSS